MGFIGDAVGSVVGGIVDPITGAITKTNPYQQQLPPINRQDFSSDIEYQRALQKQATEAQQQLAGQYALQAAGQGPNPAQEQYKQNVANAIAQQAGLIGSQKGINPGLANALIAGQGSQLQQQAAGQAATLQAQQQLAAQQQQAALQQGLASQALQGQNIFQNAQAAQNQAINAGALGTGQINAGVQGANAAAQNQTTQSIIGGAGAALAPKKAHGGVISMKEGGHVPGKAKFKGDTEENDTVHAMLSPGEVVIPRTLAHDPDKAKEFIKHLHNKAKRPKSYGEVLQAKRKAKGFKNA